VTNALTASQDEVVVPHPCVYAGTMDGEPTELTGDNALTFAREVLEEVRVDVVNWTTEYRDPRDGSVWVMDYPKAEYHGGGSPRLRRLAS
jgi:hypothetical protein